MDTCKIIQVIETTNLRRGKGIAPDDPVRVITQYWSLDGKLLWEVDPYASVSPLNPLVTPKPNLDHPWISGTAKPKGSYYTWNGPLIGGENSGNQR